MREEKGASEDKNRAAGLSLAHRHFLTATWNTTYHLSFLWTSLSLQLVIYSIHSSVPSQFHRDSRICSLHRNSATHVLDLELR